MADPIDGEFIPLAKPRFVEGGSQAVAVSALNGVVTRAYVGDREVTALYAGRPQDEVLEELMQSQLSDIEKLLKELPGFKVVVDDVDYSDTYTAAGPDRFFEDVQNGTFQRKKESAVRRFLNWTGIDKYLS